MAKSTKQLLQQHLPSPPHRSPSLPARNLQVAPAKPHQQQEQQQQQQEEEVVTLVEREGHTKMLGEGAGARGRGREANPLLSEKQKARSEVQMSIKNDIGKGVVYNVRLSRLYLAYCSLMAIATLSLVIVMVVDFQLKKPVPVWVCAVDGVMTFLVCFETVVDMVLLGALVAAAAGSGCQSPSADTNLARSCLLKLSSVLFVFLAVCLSPTLPIGIVQPLEGFVAVILLTIRYVAQFIRIVRYIRTGAEAQDSLSAVEEEVIRFDTQTSSGDSPWH
ncbi:hypothetical protein Efla_007305 [Eimeria flavescens]